ncbi:uncharacterized protein GGS25DRAFT_244581 [Hypoxylon fragiforme]|uniref:uncharacterized protein n=1 Tax=Hypoxylon fragiforme TaxID=63214 RepID=UPI0020C6207F|nr:uncharacterized protein GGS25DRAFT_244581 [Hypoxylon fragiforme]KAI2610066.1 hypothetical protein GGS25DRAFT_244581 [Hypoxylon fragiforme]
MDHQKLTTVTVPLAPREEVAQCIRTTIIFSVLVAVWTGLRLWSRRIRQLPINLPDIFFYVSVATFYAMVVCLFILLYMGGIGYHMDQLQKYHIARLTQCMLVIQALYGISMCGAKWSILWTLKNIFAVRSFQIISWIVIGFQAAWVVMTILIGLLVCRPIEKNWDPTAVGTCGDQIAAYTAVSIYNVVVDVVMCLMPIPMILKLQLKKPYKLALLGIFSIGAVSVAFATIRLLSFRQLDFNDFAYTVVDVVTWTYAEMGVVIMVACSPLLRPVFDKVFRRFMPSRFTKRSNQQSHGTLGSNVDPMDLRKPKSRVRNEFQTIGDSEESLVELGQLGRSQVVATSGKAEKNLYLQKEASDDSSYGAGILVQREITQTFK